MRRYTVFSAAIAICLMGLSGVVLAQSVYVGLENDQFGEVNLSTGTYTEIGVLHFQPNSMTFASNGSLYVSDSTVGNLWQVNPSTAASTLVGDMRISMYGLAGVSNGTVYGIDGETAPVSLYTINITSALSTVVGPTGLGGAPVDGTLAADSTDALYMTEGDNGDGFYSVNKTTGAATLIGDTGITGPIFALAWANNSMYALNSGGDIYTINLSTGVGTNTGVVTSPGSEIDAVAPVYVPAIGPAGTPEPGSMALFAGMGFASLFVAGRARRRHVD